MNRRRDDRDKVIGVHGKARQGKARMSVSDRSEPKAGNTAGIDLAAKEMQYDGRLSNIRVESRWKTG